MRKPRTKDSKYHNKKITHNGEIFDSKKEYKRYTELLALQKAGKIIGLERQVKFLLIPAQRDMDKKLLERECSYYADFVYKDTKTGDTIVEDTKGVRTAEYIIKRKLMLL
ncbi:MAG: DUF1064 domain-containing protein, partial [Acutalibacteraceae bacterium]|nr:DUF1064 domain-containing protein [Acutalibacteraceae bacterium]